MPTVLEATGLYLASRKKQSQKSFSHDREACDAAVLLHGHVVADEFRGKHLRTVRDHLLTERKARFTGEPLSRSYVNRLVRILQACWRWLLSESHVTADCAASVRAVEVLRRGQGGREPARVLPPADGWDRILHHLPYVVRAMCLVQWHGGMRPQDVCRMRRGDLSTSTREKVEFPGHPGRVVTARKIAGVPVWVYVPREHKSDHLGRPRAVPLGIRAQTVLKPLLRGLDPEEYVFPQELGRKRTHYTTEIYGCIIARAIERANAPFVAAGVPPTHLIPKWTPHQLRHLQATAVGDALSREHAQALLGHSAKADVIDRYMEQAMGKAGEAAAECG